MRAAFPADLARRPCAVHHRPPPGRALRPGQTRDAVKDPHPDLYSALRAVTQLPVDRLVSVRTPDGAVIVSRWSDMDRHGAVHAVYHPVTRGLPDEALALIRGTLSQYEMITEMLPLATLTGDPA